MPFTPGFSIQGRVAVSEEIVKNELLWSWHGDCSLAMVQRRANPSNSILLLSISNPTKQ
jgi:hypothetical protein